MFLAESGVRAMSELPAKSKWWFRWPAVIVACALSVVAMGGFLLSRTWTAEEATCLAYTVDRSSTVWRLPTASDGQK